MNMLEPVWMMVDYHIRRKPNSKLTHFNQEEMTMSKRAEEKAREKYPYETGMKGLICENSRGIYIQGYEQAEKDIISLIESRISEIMGDAQPNPVLRMELQGIIDKIK